MNQLNIAGFDKLPDEAMTSVKVIAALTGNGVSTVWRYAALNPDFPKPIKLSARCTRFRVGEVRAYLNSRKVTA
jgi:predicted DNA-binding transcriptional regulator AlpA